MLVQSPISAAFRLHGFANMFRAACLVWLVPNAREELLGEFLEAIPADARTEEIARAVLRLAARHLGS